VAGITTPVQINNLTVLYNELKVRDYKTILKCLLEEPVNIYNLFFNINLILKNITNLTEKQILELDLLSYLILLINIRVLSMGNKIFTVYQDETKTTKLEISLNNTLKQLKNCLDEFKEIYYKDNNISLLFNIPKVNDILNNNTFYIENITYKDKIYSSVDENIINLLPAKYIKTINYNCSLINQHIEKFYFYDSPVKMFSINLSLNYKIYSNIVKILFNENLASIYDNIFYLSKICNLNSSYLEDCTYGEFKIFVKKAEEMLRKKAQSTQADTAINEPQYTPVDVDSFYNAPPPSDVTPSEFMKM
jgi:hypothetical protein